MQNESNVTMGDCFPFFTDDRKCAAIIGIGATVATVSMLCCFGIVMVIIVFKKYKIFSQRLILYLCVASFFQSLVYSTEDYRLPSRAANSSVHHGLCVAQGYFTLFFDWVAFIWILCITFNVFWSALYLKNNEVYEKYFIIIDLVVPLIICCFPFIGDSYGPAGLWCWISSIRNREVYVTGVIFQFLLFYGALWFLCGVIFTMLIATLIILHHRKKQGTKALVESDINAGRIQQKLWKKEIRPIILFPIAYSAILVFPSINRLRLAAGVTLFDTPVGFFLWLMHKCTLTLHGTVYAFLFACDRQTLSRMQWRNIKSAVVEWFKDPVKEYPMKRPERKETLNKKKHRVITDEDTYVLYDDKDT